MAEGKKSFIAYSDWKDTFDALEDDKAGLLIKHIFSYVNDENPQTDDPIIKAVFPNIKNTLKRDLKKWDKQYEQRVEAGKKSAEIRKRNATVVNARSVSSTVSVSVSDSVNNNYIDLLIEEMKDGKFQTRIDTIYMQLRLKEWSLTPLIKDFKSNIIIQDVKHKSTNDVFKHFSNWLNIQDSKGNLTQYKK
jgi:hypothetical protein